MRKNGLTVTMVFLAEGANYGEGFGNVTTLKKMTRGDHQQYSYISRQAMRYNLMQQLEWDNTPVDEKSGVVQFAPSATIEDYPEYRLNRIRESLNSLLIWGWQNVRILVMQ